MKEMSVLLSWNVILDRHMIARNRSVIVKNKEVEVLRRHKGDLNEMRMLYIVITVELIQLCIIIKT